uniref:B30.2/SPRY domain-containing protein n=1 Tax=Oryzias melastigma TaxID=30732 RepID=A0A3B3BQP0_ORYME
MDQLKKTGLQAAPADHCYAGPEDVSCDVCSGRKLKAIRSCLICLASYCEKHLQPHLDEAAFKKHKLEEPSKNLQQNICSIHEEVMKMFCRTDQKCICYLCSVDEHRGHTTVSAAAERTERQRDLEESQQQIQQRIQDREKEVKLLQQEVEAINHSADQTVKDSEKIFTQMIQDHSQFLLNYPSLPPLREEEWTSISPTVTYVDVLLPEPESEPEPTTHRRLLVSEENRKVRLMEEPQSDSDHLDRWFQVLSRESLTGRCYWEVEWRGKYVYVAVAYENIIRSEYDSRFGFNDKSWALSLSPDKFSFLHKEIQTTTLARVSSRIGVYLDHRAGVLSFYSISESMTLLHRVQTTFTQPLYAGQSLSGVVGPRMP